MSFEMQKDELEKNFAEGKRILKTHIKELQQKLLSVTQDLSIANATIATRNTELDELQNTLRELEELREFRAVLCLWYNSINFFFSKLV